MKIEEAIELLSNTDHLYEPPNGYYEALLKIEDLARLAEKFKVEIHVTIYPDSAEVELMPWCKTVMESTNTTKPVEEPRRSKE